MSQTKVGTIILPTWSAVALWRGELLGQFSDGMWENSAPNDHWEFWQKLDSTARPGEVPRVEMNAGQAYPYRQKTSYNIAGLYPIIGERMLLIARMGRAIGSLYPLPVGNVDEGFTHACRAAEYMGACADFSTWQGMKAAEGFAYPHINDYMKHVSDNVAAQFFSTSYTMRDMRADVKGIRAAMKCFTRPGDPCENRW